MNRRWWLLAIGLGMLGFIVGSFGFPNPAPQYIPPLKVTGDVTRTIKLEDPRQMGELYDLSYQGHKYKAIKLLDIIKAARPAGNPEQVYLLGSDGFAVSLKTRGLGESFITFTAENGWEAINLNHPLNSNAKMLQEIVIVSDGSSPGFGVSIINRDRELLHITPGQLYYHTLLDYPCFEGRATLQSKGKSYTSAVYTRRKLVKLRELIPAQAGDRILAMGAAGEHRYLANRGYIELRDNYLSYFQPEEHSRVDNLKGVIVNPPTASIMDCYYEIRHYLESNERVLVIVIDGLNYRQYSRVTQKGYAPFLNKAPAALMASGVYPLEGKVWRAALITGRPPEENGVIDKSDQKLAAGTIFALAEQLKNPVLLLDPGFKELNTSPKPLPINGQSASGKPDEALFDLAMDQMDQDYDLIMLRFNGMTVNSKYSGQLSDRGMTAITAIDTKLERIANKWPGRMIVVGFPAMSPAGEFSCDSMLVPYVHVK